MKLKDIFNDEGNFRLPYDPYRNWEHQFHAFLFDEYQYLQHQHITKLEDLIKEMAGVLFAMQ